MSFLCLHQLDFAGNTSILIDLFKLIKWTDCVIKINNNKISLNTDTH